MNGKPTIKTIAKAAGVSHVAVSLALRGEPGISQETAVRIRRLAREMGYTPNAFARNLSRGGSSGIGMIVPAMGENTAYSAVFNIVSEVAAEHGYCVSLGCTGRRPELESKYCRMMAENRVGALIVASAGSEVQHIKEACPQVPVIFVGGKTGPEEEYAAVFDYRHSAALVVEHLCGLGHRDIALMAYGPDNLTIRQKAEGFAAEMEKRGLPAPVYVEGDAGETLAAGERLAGRLMEQGRMPTAVWCASDLMAVGVLRALASRGLSAPGDLSVVGHDNLFFDQFPGVDLTSLDMPKEEVAHYVVNLALSLMRETDETPPPKRVFRPVLVPRSSSGPPKTD